jgi:HD superfamily phosphodiesterase
MVFTVVNKMLSENEIIEILRRDLKPKRFEHSLCVAREAKRLAAKYGADEEFASRLVVSTTVLSLFTAPILMLLV